MVKKRIEIVDGTTRVYVVEGDVERFERRGYSKPKPARRPRKQKIAQQQEEGDQ